MKRGKRIRVVNVLTMAAILLVPPLVSSQSVDEIRDMTPIFDTTSGATFR